MLADKDMAPIRVILADDHPPLRAGIRMRLEQERDITVIAEASNGTDAIRLARQMKPHLLVLDMEMPDMTGVDVARALKETDEQIRILVLSAHENTDYLEKLFESGAAAGYLIKQESLDTIVAAVRGVARGEEGWLSREVAAAMMKQRRHGTASTDPAMDELSRRELEVLKLIAHGYNNQQIGEELFIAESTVKKHVSNIYTKLDLGSRAEAAAWAWQQGIVDKED